MIVKIYAALEKKKSNYCQIVSDFQALVTKYLKMLITMIQSLEPGESCPPSRPGGLCRKARKKLTLPETHRKKIPLNARYQINSPEKDFTECAI